MNKFIGIGRWAKQIELRYTPNGKPVANSNIAINEKFGGNDNTTFLPVVMWGKTAEAAAEFADKGKMVAIEGRIRVREWDSENGKRYITEIVAESVQFLEYKDRNLNRDPNEPERKQPAGDPFKDDGQPIDINDDDLPF